MIPLWGSPILACANGLPPKMGAAPLKKINRTVSCDSEEHPIFQVSCGAESTTCSALCLFFLNKLYM